MSNPQGRAAQPDRPIVPTPESQDALASAPFDPDTANRPGWDEAAAAVLRKARRLTVDQPADAAWELLARTTIDGVTVPPLGTPALTAALPATGLPGTAPFTRGATPAAGSGWDVRALVADPDAARANAAALADLENGSTSLWVLVGPGGCPVDELPQALDGVLLDLAPVVVRAVGTTAVAAAEAFGAVLEAADLTPAAGTSLGADPIGDLLAADVPDDRDTARPFDSAALTADVRRIADLSAATGVGGFVVDATVPHEVGGGEVDELAWALAVGATYLRLLTEAGLDVDAAADLIDVRYAATDEQFITMAKLRAARLLWYRLCELSGVSADHRAQRQHAVTSRPMTTRYDPWVNLLRTTVAAFAAGAGGASAVTVLPFDAAIGIPEEFGRRMARNVSALLLEESHVGKVADPAGGAHAVEAITLRLAEHAWARFGELEEAGGAQAVVADGSFRQALSDVAQRRTAQLATRGRPLTGVSEFPLAGETLLDRRPWPAEAGWTGLGWAEPFETLRDAPPARPVLLVTLGDQAGFGPRLGFVTNLLTAGGVAVVASGPVLTAADAITMVELVGTGGAGGPAGNSGAPVALVLGTDDSYAGIGADVVDALRGAGVGAVLLAGRVPPALAGRIDDAVALGDDVLAFLVRTRERLGAGREAVVAS